MWGSWTDQCLILTPCCHCAERKCQGLSQCDTVSFPCGKGKVQALKNPQYSCSRWGTGGTWCHRKWLDGYRSDIFLISLLREYIVNCTGTTSIAKNLLHWIHCPPPPLRISTWISIIVALVSKCGRLSLRKCHKSKATQEIANFGWQIAEGSQVMKFTS